MARKKEKESLRKGQTIVIGTPGRTLDHLQNSAGWRKDRLGWVVLDEADRLLDSGFAPKIKEIMGCFREAKPSIIYCSATLDRIDKAFVELRPDSKVITGGSTDASASGMVPVSLKLEAVVCPLKQKLAVLVGLLRQNSHHGRTLVFLSNCDSVEYHYELFKRAKVIPDFKLPLGEDGVCKVHGNLAQEERHEHLKRFSTHPHSILFATDVAARGLNLAEGGTAGGVSLIVQYDAPCDRLDYVHRAGRTARGIGGQGRCVIVLGECEAEYVAALREKHQLDLASLQVDRVCKWLLVADSSEEKKKTDNDEPSDDQPLHGKSQFGLWLKRLVANIAKSDRATAKSTEPSVQSLKELGQRAYSSSIRAYATHPADERHIFHIKRLHLGHFAAAFGLDEAVADNAAVGYGHGSGGSKGKGRDSTTVVNSGTNGGKRCAPESRQAPARPAIKKVKRSVSEFAAF
jgi:ATP-dependent RNA helicase DDX31/DBP7